MKNLSGINTKRIAAILAGGLAGLAVMVAAPANAQERTGPNADDRDRRSQNVSSNESDRSSRAGTNRSSASFSITIGSRDSDRRRATDRRGDSYGQGEYRRTGYSERGYKGKRNRNRGSKLLRTESYRSKYRAKIILKEELYYDRYNKTKVCTVQAYGPEQNYVSKRRLKRIAKNYCSYGSKIRIY